MTKTQFKIEQVFGEFISKDNFSQEQITKLNNFFSQNIMNMNKNVKSVFFKPRQTKNVGHQPCAPPREYNFQ